MTTNSKGAAVASPDADLKNADWPKRTRDDYISKVSRRIDGPMQELLDSVVVEKYSDAQPRDDHGRWTDSAGAGPGSDQYSDMRPFHHKGVKILGISPQKEWDRILAERAGIPLPGGGKMTPVERAEVMAQPMSAYTMVNPNAPETNQAFQDENGKYTPERAELHEAIVQDIMKNAKPSANQTVYWIGGGPASGKSTYTKSEFADFGDSSATVNADDVKMILPEMRAMVAERDPNASAYVHEESSDVAKDARSRLAKMGASFVIDAVGDNGYESLERNITKVRSQANPGARIVANYMTLDTDLAVKLANERGLKEGRFVPEHVVRDGHAGVSRVLPLAMKNGLFDEATLWDTNEYGKPVKIAHSTKGGAIEILDQEKWDRFLRKADD